MIIPEKICILLILVAIVGMCCEARYLMNKSGTLGGTGIKASSVLYSFLVCYLLYAFPRQLKGRLFDLLASLGRYSFGIYLGHVYLLYVISKLVRKWPIPPLWGSLSFVENILLWIGFVFVVVFLNYAVLKQVKKHFPNFSMRFIGV